MTVALQGFETPAALVADPCIGEYENYEVAGTSITMDASLGWVFEGSGVAPSGEAGAFVTGVAGGSYAVIEASTMESVVETHVRWWGWCSDIDGHIDLGSMRPYWVPLVTQETVVPALLAHLEEYLEPPVVEFPSRDPSYGWLYVKAPMDVRIDPPAGVSLTATVTNITGSVTATVSADPTTVTFEPGDVQTATLECSIEQATAPFAVETPGSCSVTYYNSSAIAPEQEFWTRTLLTYEVTTSSEQFPGGPVYTGHWEPVQVAEVQGVVVAS